MTDTHGETGKGWYGFDLDVTFTTYGSVNSRKGGKA